MGARAQHFRRIHSLYCRNQRLKAGHKADINAEIGKAGRRLRLRDQPLRVQAPAFATLILILRDGGRLLRPRRLISLRLASDCA